MTTVVFTDVVDSTAHRSQIGERSADELFRRHERALNDVITAHGGSVLKSVGDGVMAVFDAASDAVAAGVAVHRAVAQATPQLVVRVGIAAGDVSWEGDDCFGLPVVVAKRLESAAPAGKVLVSSVVRLMAGDRASVDYVEIEPLTLKGIDGPVDAFMIEAAPAQERRTSAFPTQLPWSDRPFAGRSAELDELRAVADAATGGEPQVVLVGGEAGAGKTRLITELAREMHRDGATVVCGLNDTELALPYQPWIMVVEQLVGILPADVVEALRDDIAVLRPLHPRLDRLVPGLPKEAQVSPDEQAFLVLQSIAAILRAAAAQGPVVVVLDDLHWAGRQTLAVLRYLVANDPISGVLLLGTFRSNPGEVNDQLARVLADLRRVDHALRINLEGLDERAIRTLIEAERSDAVGIHRADLGALAGTISMRTGGNAFLVSELCRHLQEDGEAVPDSVLEVVAERVKALTPIARRAAETAAVVSGRLSFDVLCAVLDEDPAETAIAVTELLDSGLLHEVGGAEPAYQFAHALLRDGVAEGLGQTNQIAVHLAVAHALEQVHEMDRRPVLPELAHHFAAAAPVGGRDKAIYYGRRAADQARRTAAYEEALRVLRVVRATVAASAREYVELGIDMIDLLQRSGHVSEGLELAREAFTAATELGDLHLQAEVAMNYETMGHLRGTPTDGTEEMIGQVLAGLGDSEPVLSAQLRAASGRARALGGRIDTEELLVALEQARELDDTQLLIRSMEALLFTDADPTFVLGLAEELTELALADGDFWHSMWGTSSQVRMLVRLGRLDETDPLIVSHRTRANRYGYQIFSFMAEVFESMAAHARGDFARAEAAAVRAEEVGVDSDEADQYGVFGLLMFAIRRDQGRLEEMRPVLNLLAERDASGAWTPGLALAYAELDMHAEAAALIATLAADAFAAIPRDTVWPGALGMLAETVIEVGDRSAAVILLPSLDAYAGQTLMAGFSACLGPADRLRAGLLELVGRHDEADAAIAAATEFAAAARAAGWQAHVERTHAWICGQRGDAVGCRRHHDAALRIAEPLGMRSVLERPLVQKGNAETVTPAPVLPDGLTAREAEVVVLLAEGCSNRAIAERLHISANTAANHVRSILQKTHSANRTEAATYAIRNGLATAEH